MALTVVPRLKASLLANESVPTDHSRRARRVRAIRISMSMKPAVPPDGRRWRSFIAVRSA